MRTKILFSIMFVASGGVTVAQKLTILPQTGIENAHTTVQYNKLGSFLPAGEVLSPYLGVRMDYKFKQGHGAFAGIATNRSVVSYNFSDPETGMNNYNASPTDMRLRFEAGYQFNTKRIYFNKSGSSAKSAKVEGQTNVEKKTCGRYIQKYSCRKSSGNFSSSKAKNKGWYMSIKPSIGAALASPIKQSIITPSEGIQTSYNYKAGNWNTALITGAGFEFGKISQRLFTVSINYLKGLGNMDTRTITSTSGNKTTTATLKSATSSWNITAGIPITLIKDRKQRMFEKPQNFQRTSVPKSRCGQYKTRCIRM